MNVDDLFESLTVEEVRQTTWRTKRDIENKKEELRMLVGERYRDIIETADTISNMKIHAQQLSETLNQLSEQCKNIHKVLYLSQRSKNKRGTTVTTTSLDKRISTKGSLAAQIKLIVDMPEMVSEHIERGELILACGVFLVVQHTVSRLQFVNDDSYHSNINMACVIQNYSIHSNLHRQFLLQVAKSRLNDVTFHYQNVLESILVIYTLEGLHEISTMTKHLLETFFKSREQSLRNYLEKAQYETSVKNLLVSALRILMDALHFVRDAFLPLDQDGKDLLFDMIGQHGSLHLSNFPWSRDGIYEHLDSSISDYKPFYDIFLTDTKLIRIDPLAIREMSHEWLSGCVDMLKGYLRKLLPCCDTLTGVREIRLALSETIEGHKEEDSVSSDSRRNPLQTFDLTSLFESIHSEILEQTKLVVADVLRKAFALWCGENVHTEDHDSNRMRSHQINFFDEDFISQILWRQVEEDYIRNLTAISLQDAPCGLLPECGGDYSCDSSQEQSVSPSLLAACKLYTPAMQRSCYQLDETFSKVLQTQLSVSNASNKNQLLSVLWECILNKLNDTMEQIRVTYLASGDLHCLFSWSRYLIAMLDLCPHMAEAFRNPKCTEEDWNVSLSKKDPSLRSEFNEVWLEKRNQVISLSHQLCEKALELLADKELSRFKMELQNFLQTERMIQLCLAWQKFETQDESDTQSNPNDGLSTSLFIPSQGSLPIHNLFMNLCQNLYQIGAHMLPRRNMNRLQDYLCECLLRHYEDLLNTAEANPKERLSLPSTEALTQNQALQLLFDLRFVTTLLTRYDNNNPILNNTMQTIQSRLCNYVDPFDLEMCSATMRQLVQQAVSRSQLEYALLMAPGNLITSANSNTGSSLRSDTKLSSQQHNVLHMISSSTVNTSSSCARFMLLPIAFSTSGGNTQNSEISSKSRGGTSGSHDAQSKSNSNIFSGTQNLLMKSASQFSPSKTAAVSASENKVIKHTTSFVNSWF